MKLYLSNAIFYNRAPFDKLQMHFEENEIAVLTAVNGRGKTTILSHIVDAFHEIARPFFQGEYEGKENKFYRVSSQIEHLDLRKPSISYLRFRTSTDEVFDYINARGALTEAAYNEFDLPEKRIQFSEISDQLEAVGYAKKVSSTLNRKKAELAFASNLLTYFPAYRYESPGYLNDPYKIELEFAKTTGFSGRLSNLIEVHSGLPQLANWLLDVVLDVNAGDVQSIELLQNLNLILTSTVTPKGHGPLRFGVGPRSFGGTRIQIMKDKVPAESLYPSIFNISSGEASMLCLFGELIRQADKIRIAVPLSKICGIVLIDEVDKHLHIKLQKEILPTLFTLFPNVQFIVSSHSPFLSMGLAEAAPDRGKIVDLESYGISKDPTTNELYAEVYRMMLGENDRFKELYRALEETVKKGVMPLVITEGKTDVQHLMIAKERLGIQGCDVEFFDIPGDWGDSKLKVLLDQLSKIPQTRRIIGIFDRDVASVVSEIEKDGAQHKDYGNNVYAFCLPIPLGREKYTNISIEFFYSDHDLRTEKDGRRLYFDNEVVFEQSAARKNERVLVKRNALKIDDEFTKKIFDENVGVHDWIHSKAVFSNLVVTEKNFSQHFDFSNFQIVFDRLIKLLR